MALRRSAIKSKEAVPLAGGYGRVSPVCAVTEPVTGPG